MEIARNEYDEYEYYNQNDSKEKYKIRNRETIALLTDTAKYNEWIDETQPKTKGEFLPKLDIPDEEIKSGIISDETREMIVKNSYIHKKNILNLTIKSGMYKEGEKNSLNTYKGRKLSEIENSLHSAEYIMKEENMNIGETQRAVSDVSMSKKPQFGLLAQTEQINETTETQTLTPDTDDLWGGNDETIGKTDNPDESEDLQKKDKATFNKELNALLEDTDEELEALFEEEPVETASNNEETYIPEDWEEGMYSNNEETYIPEDWEEGMYSNNEEPVEMASSNDTPPTPPNNDEKPEPEPEPEIFDLSVTQINYTELNKLGNEEKLEALNKLLEEEQQEEKEAYINEYYQMIVEGKEEAAVAMFVTKKEYETHMPENAEKEIQKTLNNDISKWYYEQDYKIRTLKENIQATKNKMNK